KKAAVKKAKGPGGARKGAGRPKIIKGKTKSVSVVAGKAHVDALKEIAKKYNLKGESETVRYLIEHAPQFTGEKTVATGSSK
ncbi:MAG: hypothetical protein KDA89_25050, partial [Planctomycetaceae bacterium]|nr:hypothetical protein [Planctomycetaceae bacterium]